MAKRHLYNFNKMALFFLLFITALKIADLFPAFGALLKLHSSWEDMMTAVPAAIISEYVIQYVYKIIRPDLNYITLSSWALSPTRTEECKIRQDKSGMSWTLLYSFASVSLLASPWLFNVRSGDKRDLLVIGSAIFFGCAVRSWRFQLYPLLVLDKYGLRETRLWGFHVVRWVEISGYEVRYNEVEKTEFLTFFNNSNKPICKIRTDTILPSKHELFVYLKSISGSDLIEYSINAARSTSSR